MGLDMYLERTRNNQKEEVGYWRKANQIFGWIVNRYPETHECNEVELTMKDLKELLKTCVSINGYESLAKEILPPMRGFFFGTYEIDERYWKDINLTIRIIAEVIDNHEEDDVITFVASW